MDAATRLKLPPGLMTPELVPPDLAVTVCGAVSSLSNTTVVPLATVSVPGWNRSPAMPTVLPPAAAAARSAAAVPVAVPAPSRSQTMTTGPASANPTNNRTTRIPARLGPPRRATWLMLPSRPSRAAGFYQTGPRPGRHPGPSRALRGPRPGRFSGGLQQAEQGRHAGEQRPDHQGERHGQQEPVHGAHPRPSRSLMLSHWPWIAITEKTPT